MKQENLRPSPPIAAMRLTYPEMVEKPDQAALRAAWIAKRFSTSVATRKLLADVVFATTEGR